MVVHFTLLPTNTKKYFILEKTYERAFKYNKNFPFFWKN